VKTFVFYLELNLGRTLVLGVWDTAGPHHRFFTKRKETRLQVLGIQLQYSTVQYNHSKDRTYGPVDLRVVSRESGSGFAILDSPVPYNSHGKAVTRRCSTRRVGSARWRDSEYIFPKCVKISLWC